MASKRQWRCTPGRSTQAGQHEEHTHSPWRLLLHLCVRPTAEQAVLMASPLPPLCFCPMYQDLAAALLLHGLQQPVIAYHDLLCTSGCTLAAPIIHSQESWP